MFIVPRKGPDWPVWLAALTTIVCMAFILYLAVATCKGFK